MGAQAGASFLRCLACFLRCENTITLDLQAMAGPLKMHATLVAAACMCSVVASATQCPTFRREILSKHKVLATFQGLRKGREPMLRIYPPKPAKDWAVFQVQQYLEYQKLGKYGDAETTEFAFVPREQSDLVQETIATLQKGAHVELEWEHDYVTRQDCSGGSSSYPERKVVQILELNSKDELV